MKHEDSKIHSNRLNVIFTLLYLPQKNWKRHFSIIKKPRQKILSSAHQSINSRWTCITAKSGHFYKDHFSNSLIGEVSSALGF